jgi:cold shock CspA family protein
MRGRITSWFDNKWIIRPTGSDVFCHEADLPPGSKGLEVEFDLVPDRGMFRAVNLKTDQENEQ